MAIEDREYSKFWKQSDLYEIEIKDKIYQNCPRQYKSQYKADKISIDIKTNLKGSKTTANVILTRLLDKKAKKLQLNSLNTDGKLEFGDELGLDSDFILTIEVIEGESGVFFESTVDLEKVEECSE